MRHDAFAGDQTYLRHVQYADSSKFRARVQLHVKYGRGDWFEWLTTRRPWPAGAAVLEVGCGPGLLWSEADGSLPYDVQLTLSDLSIGMVREALTNLIEIGRFEHARGLTADAQVLPFPSRRFDVVVSNHMLYHVPEPHRAVAEMARVVAADGSVRLATNGRDHLRELWDLKGEVFPGASIAASGLGDGGLEAATELLSAHFRSVEVHHFDDHLRCTDPEDVFDFVRSYPPGEDATPDQQRHLRAAIDRRFDAGGGVFEITKTPGVVIAADPISS